MRRALIASVAINAVLTVVLLAWVTWIVVEPQHWFADAYEQPEPGPPGQPGPAGALGPRGPRGIPGPPGISAESNEFEVEELRSTVEELSAKVDAMCDEFFYQREIEALRQLWLNAC